MVGTGRVGELKGAAKEAVIFLNPNDRELEKICHIFTDWFDMSWTQTDVIESAFGVIWIDSSRRKERRKEADKPVIIIFDEAVFLLDKNWW